MNVLIADDSDVVRERLAALLSELPGVETVRQARSATEGENLIRELGPDVAILDIRFPDGSGLDVLEAVKGDCPNTAFIMLTSFPYPQYRLWCLQAGADYFLDKAAEFHRLPQIIAELASRSTTCEETHDEREMT